MCGWNEKKKCLPHTIRRYTKATRNLPNRRKNGAAGPRKRTGIWNGNTVKSVIVLQYCYQTLQSDPVKSYGDV